MPLEVDRFFRFSYVSSFEDLVELLSYQEKTFVYFKIVKLRQESGKDRQGMALKAKGLKA